MVFGLLETALYSFSSPYKRWRDSSLSNHLRSEGLSRQEADNVAWMIETRAKGEGYGFVVGCFLAYKATPQFNKMRLR